MKRDRALGYLFLAAYMLCIPAANWTLTHIGQSHPVGPRTVPVWPGVAAPSGVLWIGVALTLRDLTQDTLGRWWTLGAIAVGAALSFLVADAAVARASGVAFLLSETADFAVYTPLRARHWLGAIAASNVVGLAVDSVLFLWLAFGSLDFLAGQLIGKAVMTGLAVVVLWAVRRPRRMREAQVIV